MGGNIIPINHKDEYSTLRQEILQRFERIHDISKYGIGGFIAFISFYFSSELFEVIKPLDNLLALLIMQLIVALMGLSLLNSYQRIYSIGTYIAVIIETGKEGKWHRMSRGYPDYLVKKKLIKGREKCFYPIGEKWGTDSATLSFILFALIWVSFLTVWLKVKCFNAFIPSDISHWIVFFIMLFFIGINIVIFCKLLGIQEYRKKLEERWIEYSKDFDKKDGFSDPFKDADE